MSSINAAEMVGIAEISEMYHERYQYDSQDEKACAAADAIADVLVRNFHPRTACDVGCGGGALIRGLLKRGVDAVGIEGSKHAAALLPDRISLWDLRNALQPKPPEERYELVTCFDVAEHVDAAFADVLVSNLVSLVAPWGWLVFGPAPEGQDGHGHVNCQHPCYWIEKLQGPGFDLFSRYSEQLRAEMKASDTSHLWWIPKNLMVFALTGLSHRSRAYFDRDHYINRAKHCERH